jgi:hypothetical protein
MPRPCFDAYVVVDWSARSVPATGPDSVWWSLALRGGGARTQARNPPTRHDLVSELGAALRGPLADRRVLVGFDLPLGYPRGFAAALGHRGSRRHAWRHVWGTLRDLVGDDERNANNRFEVAAALNARVSGGFGPFFGRPPRVPAAVAAHLSSCQRGVFDFSLRTRSGATLARLRLADAAARTASSPWFVYGGANSVGGQALVGIPHLARLREAFPDSRVWPFETGTVLPPRTKARIVVAEVYPTMFHLRRGGAEVHDRLQVIATAEAFARLDAEGRLDELFAAAPEDPAVLDEEGWVLGATRAPGLRSTGIENG